MNLAFVAHKTQRGFVKSRKVTTFCTFSSQHYSALRNCLGSSAFSTEHGVGWQGGPTVIAVHDLFSFCCFSLQRCLDRGSFGSFS